MKQNKLFAKYQRYTVKLARALFFMSLWLCSPFLIAMSQGVYSAEPKRAFAPNISTEPNTSAKPNRTSANNLNNDELYTDPQDLQLAFESKEETLKLLTQPIKLRVGNTLVHEAASLSSAKVVKLILENSNIDINTQNHIGHTALHIAFITQNWDTANFLLSHPQIDLNLKNIWGDNLMHIALLGSTGSTGATNWIIAFNILLSPPYIEHAKAMFNESNLYGQVPLDFTFREQYVYSKLYEMLIEQGVPFLLHRAVANYHLPAVLYFTKYKDIDINSKDLDGNSALKLNLKSFETDNGELEIKISILKALLGHPQIDLKSSGINKNFTFTHQSPITQKIENIIASYREELNNSQSRKQKNKRLNRMPVFPVRCEAGFIK